MSFADLLALQDRRILSTLGATVRYAPAWPVVSFVDVTGIFDAAYVRASILDASVMAAQPAVFVRLSDLVAFDPSTDSDPTVIVSGTSYKVREAQPDGLGGVLLLLQERA